MAYCMDNQSADEQTGDVRTAARQRRDVHYLDKTIMKAREWIKEIQHDLYLDMEHDAYLALRTVLHCLRDHLNTDEVAQFGAQLPTLIRGFYYEGWDPHPKPKRMHDAQEFYDEVKENIKEGLNPAYITEGILGFLEHKIGHGEVNTVKKSLPQAIALLWPQNVFKFEE
jgi:uncharacterized protein (DUF2267 family)